MTRLPSDPFLPPMVHTTISDEPTHVLPSIVLKYWGYGTLRPLQAEAMACVMEGRDSLVVLPTGGGKSLCFQAPAVATSGTAVVISPLLSLMKDQTDALGQCGVSAACLNSMQSSRERSDVMRAVKADQIKLLYVAPERLASDQFMDFLREIRPAFFAVDEAHCISSWGHEFRADYRKLAILRRMFPEAGIHGYTATATQRVRDDIVQQLGLRNPTVLVGSFDRPNLTYRVERKAKKWQQICTVIERHKRESGIIYCISRKNVDNLCGSLREAGYRALPYHAGMQDADRKRNQEAFIREKADIIVATVAFGMGIDKSNVRYVLHAGSPCAIESYQQEAGRAGRDGLPSECVLLWGPGDFILWRKIKEDLEPEAHRTAMEKLSQMSRFCESSVCRHRALVKYFGQELDSSNCAACDRCLAEGDQPATDSLAIAQKILSCVVRLRKPPSPDYIVRVLVGDKDDGIIQHGHDKLTTFGIMANEDRRDVRIWIEQLQAQNYLESTDGSEVLGVTEAGWTVIRGQETPRLARTCQSNTTSRRGQALLPTDQELFEELRTLRRMLADERNVAAFVVFSDATLTEMAIRRPGSMQAFVQVSGVGQTKCLAYGRPFVECIRAWCHERKLPTDVNTGVAERSAEVVIPPEPISNDTVRQAFALFAKGISINDAVCSLKRARSTVSGYLAEFIMREKIISPDAWIDFVTIAKIHESANRLGIDRLKPIYDDLGGTVDYESIRICVACLHNSSAVPTA